MKEKVTAIISFLAGIGWGLFGLYSVTEQSRIDGEEFIAYLALFTSTISIMLYVVWTKFGKKEYTELDKVNYENKLLKSQIEQKELRKKLDE